MGREEAWGDVPGSPSPAWLLVHVFVPVLWSWVHGSSRPFNGPHSLIQVRQQDVQLNSWARLHVLCLYVCCLSSQAKVLVCMSNIFLERFCLGLKSVNKYYRLFFLQSVSHEHGSFNIMSSYM